MFNLSQRIERHPMTDQHTIRAADTQVFFDRLQELYDERRNLQAVDNEIFTQIGQLMTRRSGLLGQLADTHKQIEAVKAKLQLYESMRDDPNE